MADIQKGEVIAMPGRTGRAGDAVAMVGGEAEGDTIDLLALLRTLWLGKLWILGAMLIAGALAFGYVTYIAVPLYTANASVALENRQAQVVDLESVVSGLSGDQATINTEAEVLRSRNLMGAVVDRMKLMDDPEFNPALTRDPDLPPLSDQVARDATIQAVTEATSIANVSSSYVFRITTLTSSPEKSRLLANTVAQLYIQDQLNVKADATTQAVQWLNDRVVSLKAQLETAEEKVKNFTASTDLVSSDALDGINVQIKNNRERLASLAARAEQMTADAEALAAAGEAGDRDQIVALAGDPALAGLAQSGAAPEAFDKRFEAVLAAARSDAGRVSAQVASLRASVATLEADYQRQSADLLTLEQLKREAEATRTLYEYFLSRLKETSVQEGIQQPDARILSAAALPTNPSEPRKKLVLAMALMLGLIAGAGLVLLRELLHSGYRTADQLEQESGVSVMGQLPRIPARDRLGVIRYLSEKPTSAAAEAVRNLRTSVLLSNVDKPPKVILSSSSLSGEGKTTNAIALAQNFAGLGKKVLLIEGDIRRRVFSLYFDLPQDKGLLSVLSGAASFDDVVQKVELIGVDVLVGEQSSTNAADVYSSERFAAFMADMRKRYDVVIIDTPPVLLVPDARIIARGADAVLFTVRWDTTSRAQVRESIRQFAMAGVSITGMILSQIDPKGMKRYGYGNGYSYYGYGDKNSKYYDN